MCLFHRLTCVIGKGTTNQAKGISISVNASTFDDPKISYYSFKEPKLHEVSPMKGIVAGNTTVTIIGSDIGFEGQNRYNISFCNIETCLPCSELQSTINTTFIKCKTGKSEEPRNMTQLQIVIDDLTVLTLNETFQYLSDPTFNISNEAAISIESGGVTFTIRGKGFNNVGEITVERVIEPCIVPEDTSAVCETPSKIQFKQNNQTVRVYFDGVILLVIIQYVDDPTFERFSNVLEYDKESSIQIKVEVKKIMAYIGDLRYTGDDNNVSLLVGLLIGGLVTSIIIGISAISILRRNKKRAVKKCKLEMSEGLSERQANLRNDDELDHIEENGSTYCEINPDDELQSDTNINKHPDINEGYEHLANRSQKDPYNQLNQESADNQIGDMINVDNRTEDSPASDYIDIES
ncbi:Hypothetical predicted protein [Mytilus galloprovincialis]|uniref:IPT/TIG domain-containing protein n=1 Tax=Mytilus galloprovincialis TaxID=29158 RepID=A0A8B6GNT4_MYTGA|nr:Hypothetical predicted protein [Mytilus galloprovincialis]